MNSAKIYVLFLLTVVLIMAYYHLYIENTSSYKISSTVTQNAPALPPRSKQNSVVIYNRVPKTGSTSFMNVAYELFPSNGYVLYS